MKIAFNGIVRTYKIPENKASYYNNKKKPENNASDNVLGNYSYLKPLPNSAKLRRAELKEIDELTDENGVFSLDKAAELIKSKIDKQLMLYSEKDIKTVTEKVMKDNPAVSKERVLKTLMKISNFSNYDSLTKIEKFLKENKVFEVYKTKGLTINNIMYYLSRMNKMLLKLPSRADKNYNIVIFADRDTVKEIKRHKDQNETCYYDLKANIKNGSMKLVILDGFEAKTDNGLKSFNFAGSWGNLTDAVSSVIKAEKEGKNPFVDDIKSDLKEIFGEDVNISILNNDIENLDEKAIADRLNAKTISKEEIKKSILGISKYSIANLFLTYGVSSDNIDLKTVQKGIIKTFYPVMEVYSPRRLAEEMKNLHKNIEEKLFEKGKTFDDTFFVVPDKNKSFGLISYQYSKANNTKTPFIYPDFKDVSVDRNLTRGKTFVFLDDFSGSAQSFMSKDLPYQRFKRMNPANSIIFAPIAYTDFAKEKVNKEIINLKNELRHCYDDYFIGETKLKDTNSYLKLLPKEQYVGIIYSKKCGYNAGMNVITFPHVIPDNCMDIAGYLLKPVLKSDCANKATMDFQKECRIMTLSEK